MKKNYLLFLGSGRTGSTLVGFLINKHPEAAITIESRILDKAVSNKQPVKKYLKDIKRISGREYLIQDKYLDKKNDVSTWNKWQSDWIYPNENTFIKKSKKIKMYGDKKQGGTTSLISKDEKRVFDSLNGLNLFFTSCIRHPFSVVDSYSRLGLLSDKTFNDYVQNTLKGLSIVKKKRGHIVFYESLLRSPEDELYNLFKYLNLYVDKPFIDSLLPLINTKKIVDYPKIPNDLRKQIELKVPEILSIYKDNPDLNV